MMLVSIRAVLLVVCLVLCTTHLSEQYYGNPNCAGGSDVFVHLFEWKWSDIANECETFLGPAGYCAVQVSPPNEHRIIIGEDGYIDYPWYQRYQPVSYILHSRSGDVDEFVDMVQRCNDAGVRIYADAIINHMAQDGQGYGSGGSYWDGTSMDFPAVPYSYLDFHGSDVCHTHDMNIHNYQDADEVRYCRLNNLKDLEHSSSYVEDKIVGYLNNLIDIGVAGFRVDASKHMFTYDVERMMGRLNNLNTQWFEEGATPFVFMEVIDMGGEPIRAVDYTYIGRVTEFKHCKHLGDVVRKNNGQRLAYLHNYGEPWDQLAGLSAIVFTDNHDNQRGHGAGGFNSIVTFFEDREYKIANAFQLAWNYGYVKVMSSYNWPRDIQNGKDVNHWMGPPSDEGGETRDVSCFDEWICEHRWRQIYNMVRFHNTVMGTDVVNWWDNGYQAIAFGREGKGFIVINNEDFPITETLQTSLPDGEYCNVITCEHNVPVDGDCGETGDGCSRVTVSGGAATFTVPNDLNPMFAIHV